MDGVLPATYRAHATALATAVWVWFGTVPQRRLRYVSAATYSPFVYSAPPRTPVRCKHSRCTIPTFTFAVHCSAAAGGWFYYRAVLPPYAFCYAQYRSRLRVLLPSGVVPMTPARSTTTARLFIFCCVYCRAAGRTTVRTGLPFGSCALLPPCARRLQSYYRALPPHVRARTLPATGLFILPFCGCGLYCLPCSTYRLPSHWFRRALPTWLPALRKRHDYTIPHRFFWRKRCHHLDVACGPFYHSYSRRTPRKTLTAYLRCLPSWFVPEEKGFGVLVRTYPMKKKMCYRLFYYRLRSTVILLVRSFPIAFHTLFSTALLLRHLPACLLLPTSPAPCTGLPPSTFHVLYHYTQFLPTGYWFVCLRSAINRSCRTGLCHHSHVPNLLPRTTLLRFPGQFFYLPRKPLDDFCVRFAFCYQ